MLPAKFKASASGQWMMWTSGSFDSDSLRSKVKKVPAFVNGCQVVALQFPNGSTWDVYEGWREPK